jgi:predicted RNA methylase
MDLMKRGIRSLREKGIIRTVQSVICVVEDTLFDRTRHLDTNGIIEAAQLDVSEPDKKHIHKYQPTRVRLFRKLMQSMRLPTSQVFVDVGCGKGRILVAAAEYGFERIVGVEISPQLSATARRNIDICRRSGIRAEIEVHCANILDVELRNDEAIFYLYWPFDRWAMQKLVAMLRASLRANEREMWLIVNNFSYDDFLGQDPDFIQRQRFVYGGGEVEIFHHPRGHAPELPTSLLLQR